MAEKHHITASQIDEIRADNMTEVAFGAHEKRFAQQRSLLLGYISQQFQERSLVDSEAVQLRARIAQLQQANATLTKTNGEYCKRHVEQLERIAHLEADKKALTFAHDSVNDETATHCQVCRGLVMYGSRHSQCGNFVMQIETENQRLRADFECATKSAVDQAEQVLLLKADAENTWRCFHCGEVCKSQVDARNHFGSLEGSEPACQIKVAGEFALLRALRNAEERLQRYHAEDSDIMRAMASMQSDHNAALRREEEAGYGKAVAHIRAESDLLKAALRWVFESGAILSVHTVDGVRHPRVVNCGDFDSMEIPPQLAPLIAEAVK